MLPTEMWEMILKKYEQDADPVDFARLKSVCKTWNALITKLSRKSGKWYLKCRASVPELLWSTILEHKFHPKIDCRNFHRAKKHPSVFMSLYKSWIQLRKLNRTNVITQQLEAPPLGVSTRITCVAALGNIVASGDSDGCVQFYDIATVKKNPMSTAYYPPGVKDIQLWRKGANIVAIIFRDDQRIKYWDINSKKEVRGPMDAGVSFVSACFNYSYKVVETEGEKPLLVIEHRANLRSSERWLMRLNFNNKFIAASSEGNKVMLWMEHDCHIKYREIKTETCIICPFMIRVPDFVLRRPQFLTFKPRIIAYVDRGQFGFSISGGQWTKYHSLRCFRAFVTAILFHARILVLGLSSGVLHIYKVEDVKDLEHFDFVAALSTEINLYSSEIVSLKMTECNSEQHLVAVTVKNRIHIVKFANEEGTLVPPLQVQRENQRRRRVEVRAPVAGISGPSEMSEEE